MTETLILDEGAVSEIEAQGWKKGFPDLDGDYYCRVDEYDKQPTPIRIESRSASTSAAVYEFGCSDDLRREYEAEEDYEYLGPLNPESIPALCATVKYLREDAKSKKIELLQLSGRGELLAKEHVKFDELDEVAAVRNELDRLRNIVIVDLQSQLEQLRAENERLKSQRMIVRDDAERFIKQYLHSAQWEGETLMITFENESLIAALIGDVEKLCIRER